MAGSGRRKSHQETLVAVAVVVQGSLEGAEERVHLGNLGAVVGPLVRFEGDQAGVAARRGEDVVARVLHGHLVSRYFALVRGRAYVRFLEGGPLA